MTMTQDTLFVYIAAVLTTAKATEPATFPESMGYVAIGSNKSTWETVKKALTIGDLCTFTGHQVCLTKKGRVLAVVVESMLPSERHASAPTQA
jgi:hypothetical protein